MKCEIQKFSVFPYSKATASFCFSKEAHTFHKQKHVTPLSCHKHNSLIFFTIPYHKQVTEMTSYLT